MDPCEQTEPEKVVNGAVYEKDAPEQNTTVDTNGGLNGHDKTEAASEFSEGGQSEPREIVTNGTQKAPEIRPDTPEPDTTTDHRSEEERDHGSEPGSHDEVDETESEGGEEEEEDDEDYEPALKYDLLGGATETLLEKDSASALAVSPKYLAMGTHNGIIHVLDYSGQRIKSYRPHSASVIDICFDSAAEFVATASIDGQVVIHSLSTPEVYAFDKKRPMRTIALEPNFSKRSSRTFVCGGMAGNLILHEKGWLGHKETVIHAGEGPIWMARWRGTLIAWANDAGVKIYDTSSQTRITYIDRPPDSPRADLFKCTLHWQDDTTLLIAWADTIKVARVRSRPRGSGSSGTNSPAPGDSSRMKVLPPLMVEITAILAIDDMLAGIVPHPADPVLTDAPSAPSAFLVLAYSPPDTSFKEEAPADAKVQARKLASRPELRIISRKGEEMSSDVLGISGYQTCGCNDYWLAEVPEEGTGTGAGRCYVVLNPRSIVLVRPRDRRDHISWLVERKRYEEALEQIERMPGEGLDAAEIGQRYIEHLVNEGEYEKAAQLCPKVLSQDAQRWEDWIFVYAQKNQLQAIIPYIPTETPRLSRLVYEMILAHFLAHDREALLRTVKEWPNTIYDVGAVTVAVQSELSHVSSSSAEAKILMECLTEMYLANHQPGKALPYVLRLRRENVFDLIREYNLFTDVQDQALLLVEFDQELVKQRQESGGDGGLDSKGRSPAIALLVDHTFSIPVPRVVQQLEGRPQFLYLYLDALFAKDPHLASDYADEQVQLYAQYAPNRLIDFLRASNYYSLEKAYLVCKERDYVPEMVFLLGRMGNNKQALTLIIERLGDVNRAIDFAKEQNDDDLWEDLLRYSETRPAFIRGLLENVGAEIDPIRLIRRIKNGLEIPGLKEALIKILQAFNLQISLLEGCQTILDGDCSTLARKLHKDQTKGFFETAASKCLFCNLPLHQGPTSATVLFLCRHVVHLSCVKGGDRLSRQQDPVLSSILGGKQDVGAKIAFAAMVRRRIDQGCPVCHKRDEGERAA
ncbi:vacuolar assembling protein VPS41 [Fomitiporia mediterranea MF3/22]|uniref:vacuolar assembling protein VPS41 n=1 Tax=Fomitiporia mediterranea (strain MF3/22) TaxID=694068 RepID=UPI00044079CC|nr:vacuolar assembling protein VPS41 [Fomitiporia mediterranea MF3/22]EJD01725.1 vacuolar assembling protein VPS41 [Fomitiporia mediterranea MF3/22]